MSEIIMNREIVQRRGSWARRLGAGALMAALPLALAGCGDLFSVNNPVDILESDLGDQRTIPALANSAEAAVVSALDQAIQYAELVTDGAIHIATNQGNVALDVGVLGEYNERAEAVYNNMASARWTATEVTQRLEALVANPAADASVGRSYYWDAVARIVLADVTEEVTFDGGPPISPAAVYEGAIQLLDKAATISAAVVAAPATPAATRTLAQRYVAGAHATRARAHRSLYFEKGANDITDFQLAAEYAQRALNTLSNFRIDARYAPPGSSNGLFTSWRSAGFYDVMGPDFANRIDPVSGLRDTRIRHTLALTQLSPFGDSIYEQQKYVDRNSPIRVSGWQEAQLIIAEYNLLIGNLPEAVARINTVRTAANLPPFAAATAQAVRDQLLYERATEFWLEGRRWPDMRYYNIIPRRWDPAMQARGVNRRFPVSLREMSTNPHYRDRIGG